MAYRLLLESASGDVKRECSFSRRDDAEVMAEHYLNGAAKNERVVFVDEQGRREVL